MSKKILFNKYKSLSVLSKFCVKGVLLSIVSLVLYLCSDCKHNIIDFFIVLIGAWALSYILYIINLFFFQPIERDMLLARKSYWHYVLLFVVAIPFLCSTILILCNVSQNEFYLSDSEYLLQCKYCDTTYIIKETETPHIFWDVYYHFVDPGNQHDTTAKGKIYTGILAILGIFLFNGLLVSTIIGWVDQRKNKWQRGRIRYKLWHLPKYNYAVVIGANEISASVIKNLLQPKSTIPTLKCVSNKVNRYVILQTSEDVEKVRDVLASHLKNDELGKVIIYNALRDSKTEIAWLHLEFATEIYILGENTTINGGETYHDAMNMRCLNLMAEYLHMNNYSRTKGCKRKVCHMMFDYRTTYSIFQFSDISEMVNDTLVFIPFNRYESWARRVFVDCIAGDDYGEPIEYIPLDGFEGIKFEDNKRVHLVIVGMSKMGVAMGAQALLQLHFPNYVRDRSLKSRVTFIDTYADKEMAFFKGRYSTLFELARHRYLDANKCCYSEINSDYGWIDPMQDMNCQWKHLDPNGDNFLDVEVEFIKGELESKGVRHYLKEVSKNEHNSKLTIAICLTQTHQAIAASLYMPIEVYRAKNLQQILVYQREAADIVDNLRKVKDKSMRYTKLRPFGMLYGEYMETKRRYFKAQLVNMAYKKKDVDVLWPNDVLNKEDVGTNYMRQAWSELSISLKMSNNFFGDTIYQKMRSMMCLPNNQAIGGYRNDMFDNALLYDELNSTFLLKLPKDMDDFIEEEYENNPVYRLAQTEHNRWNMEKLLMGFSPMNKEEDEQFRLLVREKRTDEIEQLKKDYKSSANNIHPNICDFQHLRVTDKGALRCDVMLQNAIPYILLLVDGYRTASLSKLIEENMSELGKLICRTLGIKTNYY